MRVEDLLKGSLSIGEEQVDSLTSQLGSSQGSSDALGNTHHVSGRRLRQINQSDVVATRNDKNMAIRHGIDVHERDNTVVLPHNIRLRGILNNPAEYAVLILHDVKPTSAYSAIQASCVGSGL